MIAFTSEQVAATVNFARSLTQAGDSCIRCGRPVPVENSLVVFDVLLHSVTAAAIADARNVAIRHVAPVLDDEGNVICRGSPNNYESITGNSAIFPGRRNENSISPAAVAAWQLMQKLPNKLYDSGPTDIIWNF